MDSTNIGQGRATGRGASAGSAASPTEKSDEAELELPALDGEDDGAELETGVEPLDESDDGGDPFDDATQGEGTPFDEIAVEGAEAGWLVDADTAQGLDLGAFDIVIRPEDSEETNATLLDEEEAIGSPSDDLVEGDERTVADGGEEGPLDDDEELREEDLPALDADDDGEVADDDLYDRAQLVADDELRWDDRAWARVTELETRATQNMEIADDSGILAVPGEDPTHATRDATWKRLEETSQMMAATFLPGGSAVVALASSDRTRARIIRIQADGEARIIAEVEATKTPDGTDDDGESCAVTFLRWDPARGCLFVGGTFGVEAYRPTP